MARGILFIPGWYACSLVSSTESLFSTLRLFFPSLPPRRPMPRCSTILYQGGCQHGRLSLTTFSYIERNKYQCPIEENSHLHRNHTLATLSRFRYAIVTCWFNFSVFWKESCIYITHSIIFPDGQKYIIHTWYNSIINYLSFTHLILEIIY